MIEIKHLFKTYEGAQGGTDALRDVSLRIEDGEIYGIIGMSGAGKSTLVRCINLLERPTMGEVLIDGCNIATLPDRELREKRRNIAEIAAQVGYDSASKFAAAFKKVKHMTPAEYRSALR